MNQRQGVYVDHNLLKAGIFIGSVMMSVIGWFMVQTLESMDNRLNELEKKQELSNQILQRIGTKAGIDVELIGRTHNRQEPAPPAEEQAVMTSALYISTNSKRYARR